MNYNPDFEKALKDYLVNQDYTVDKFSTPFKKSQYELAKETLSNYLEGFKYMYNRIDDNKKEEFKYDTLDYLKSITKNQTLSKFKVLFNNTTTEIKSFKGYNNYYIPFEKELFSLENFENLTIIALSKLPGALEFILTEKDEYEYRYWKQGLICFDKKLKLSAISSNIKWGDGFKLSIQTDKENIIYSEMIETYYTNGYNEGLDRWKNNIALDFNKDPTSIYLKRVKNYYFDERLDLPIGIFYPMGTIKGCSFVKDFNYEKISLLGIKKLGYFTAITYQLDEFLAKSGINLKESLSPTSTEKINEHPEMFTDLASYNLFLALWKKSKGSSYELAEFSFIYRILHKERHIHNYQKPEMFKKWLRQEKFGVDLDLKLKRLEEVNKNERYTNYLLQKEILGID